jgi:hypothetical protein
MQNLVDLQAENRALRHMLVELLELADRRDGKREDVVNDRVAAAADQAVPEPVIDAVHTRVPQKISHKASMFIV